MKKGCLFAEMKSYYIVHFIKTLQQKAEVAMKEYVPLRKLAHAINRDFFALKIENFQLKMFWSENKKNMYTPAYPSFSI